MDGEPISTVVGAVVSAGLGSLGQKMASSPTGPVTALEKKIIGLNVLKEYNDTQKNTTSLIKHFIETLFVRIENRLKASLKKISGVDNLFRTLMDNTHYFEKEKGVFMILEELQLSRLEGGQSDEFEKVNESFAQFAEARKQAIHGVKTMSKNIKERILDVTLKEATLSYEKNIQSIFNKLKDFQKDVKTRQDKLNSSMQNFLKVYNENVSGSGSSKPSDKDTYMAIFEYSQQVEDIYKYFKELGAGTVELWIQSAALNDLRLEAIRKSFLEYFNLLESTYGPRALDSYTNAKKILSELRPREVTEALFGLKSIMVEDEFGMIAGKIGKRPTTTEDVREYFNSIGFTTEESNRFKTYFLKKEWKIRAGQKKQSPGSLLITIDCTIIVFARAEDEEEDKIFISHLPEKLSLELKPEKNMVNIKVKKSSFFSLNKSKHVLFDNQEDYKDFLALFESSREESSAK